MRLMPAHIHDAKEMARSLCEFISDIGLRTNIYAPHPGAPSLQKTQELMAKAMGYASWHELAGLLSHPHEPVYLDQISASDSSKLLSAFEGSLFYALQDQISFGHLSDAIANSGVGYSPKKRRAMLANSSPWGPIEKQEVLAPGVRSITTASHGGLLLSDERQQRMPSHLRQENSGYECHGEYHLVAIGFPEEAQAMGIHLCNALTYVGIIDHIQDPERLNELEQEIVQYLVQCIHLNRLPLRFPPIGRSSKMSTPIVAKLDSFTLNEWVELMAKMPKVNGEWAMGKGPWFENWAWQLREDERDRAYEQAFSALLEAPQNPN